MATFTFEPDMDAGGSKVGDPPDPHDPEVTVVASISGGKDSAAMSLWLHEQGIEHRRVFMDTGWEHPDTYEYLRGPLTKAIGPIEELRAERDFVQLTRKKGTFPSRLRRWCTTELKVKPVAAYLASVTGAINCVGIRSAESRARARLTKWEWTDGLNCWTWRPLLAWTESQVVEIHQRHGLEPNPLYLRGAERVGCWPCIYARKSEIRMVADTDPERIELIGKLEEELEDIAVERGHENPKMGFFHAKDRRGGRPWHIDEAVEWSRTAHGGRQMELFSAETEDAGCMRWGLCDQIAEDEDA